MNDTKNIMVEPCPFCGNRSLVLDLFINTDSTRYRVACECGYCSQAFDTGRKAVDAHNHVAARFVIPFRGLFPCRRCDQDAINEYDTPDGTVECLCASCAAHCDAIVAD